MRQPPCLPVNAKNDHVVGLLVGYEHVRPIGSDAKTAREFSLSRNIFQRCEAVLGGINGEDGDGVVSPVGNIEKLSRRMHCDFGGGVLAFDRLRKAGTA